VEFLSIVGLAGLQGWLASFVRAVDKNLWPYAECKCGTRSCTKDLWRFTLRFIYSFRYTRGCARWISEKRSDLGVVCLLTRSPELAFLTSLEPESSLLAYREIPRNETTDIRRRRRGGGGRSKDADTRVGSRRAAT